MREIVMSCLIERKPRQVVIIEEKEKKSGETLTNL